MKIYFDKLLKINIGHNVLDSTDLENIIKCELMRMYRRKYPNTPIYSEFYPEQENLFLDIFVDFETPLIIEIQKEINNEWKNKIKKNYPFEDLIIVPVKKVESDWLGQIKTDELINKIYNPVESLRKVLGEYLV